MPVVDASMVVAIIAPDAGQSEMDVQAVWHRWLDRGAELSAPPLLRLEVLNALLSGIRRKRWDGAAADQAHALATSLPIMVQETEADRARAWELARRYDNWPLYDMVYLALADRLGEPLVTLDERLVRRVANPGRARQPEDA